MNMGGLIGERWCMGESQLRFHDQNNETGWLGACGSREGQKIKSHFSNI